MRKGEKERKEEREKEKKGRREEDRWNEWLITENVVIGGQVWRYCQRINIKLKLCQCKKFDYSSL